MEKICKLCQQPFEGRPQALYCCDKHRWQAHSNENYAMKKEKPDPANPEFPPSRTLSGAGARRKGARGENEVCNLLTSIVGTKHVRNLDQTREGGGDIQWGPFLLEVKTTETVSMPAWQRQAIASAVPKGDVPAVVWRRKGEKWWVALPFEDFVTMFETLRTGAQSLAARVEELEKILYGAK